VFDDFAVSVDRDADQTVVRVRGDLDNYTAPELRTVIAHIMVDPPRQLTIDLVEVGFMDSSALSVLVATHHLTEAAGVGYLIDPPAPLVMKPLVLSGLDQMLPLRRRED